MTEERDTPDDLFPFAQMLVKQLKEWWSGELVCAGWSADQEPLAGGLRP